MSKYDDIARPDAMTLKQGGGQTAVVTRVQASLYARLRSKWGHSAGGRMGWLLIRAATPSHNDHEDAMAALRGRSADELKELGKAVRGTLEAAPKGAEGSAWRDLATAILDACMHAADAAGAK